MANVKKHVLKLTRKNSSVLGWAGNSVTGQRLWKELDWSRNYRDGSILDDGQSWNYLHVRVNHDPELDGEDPDTRRWYRVRCIYQIGGKYRGRVVSDVFVMRATSQDAFYWVVLTV